MSVGIIADTLGAARQYFEQFEEKAEIAAYLAINKSARDTLPALRTEMEAQIAFPKGYLNADRLGIRRKANRRSLEAVISGRERPTSLARFSPGATPENSKGRRLRVQVKGKGSSVLLKGAFLVRLRNNNIGLAVRLPKGQSLENSEKAVRLENNVYLLYGPSVDQVMRDVSDAESPQIAGRVFEEFVRQFGRLQRG